MSNPWIVFLKKHGGKGYSRKELSEMYKRKQYPRSPSGSRKSRKSRKSPRTKRYSRSGSKSGNKCRERLGRKIEINMDEYERGRYVSPSQAIAVSYAQVRKRYPACSQYL